MAAEDTFRAYMRDANRGVDALIGTFRRPLSTMTELRSRHKTWEKHVADQKATALRDLSYARMFAAEAETDDWVDYWLGLGLARKRKVARLVAKATGHLAPPPIDPPAVKANWVSLLDSIDKLETMIVELGADDDE